jgi:gluconokinase
MSEAQGPEIVVVMGVSGSGKTTIGTLLAQKIGAVFADADDYHSEANKEKMRAGIALTDEDRAPWLQTLNDLLRGWAEKGARGVLACSALKASYRDTLSAGIAPGEMAFVWMDGSREMIQQRLEARKGTYMNPALLGSQIATLEAPADAVRVVNDRAPDVVVGEVMTRLGMAE